MPVSQETNHARNPAINAKTKRHPGASDALPFFPVLVLLSLFGVNSINKPKEMPAVQANICIIISIIQNSIYIMAW